MIGYVSFGTNDLSAAAEFYDELFNVIGGKRFMQEDQFVAWAVDPSMPGLALTKPYNGEPATVGNGTMVAIAVDSPEKVDAMHAKALELGGMDEGAPGQRSEVFYAAYFRDLDGNKLNAFFMKHG